MQLQTFLLPITICSLASIALSAPVIAILDSGPTESLALDTWTSHNETLGDRGDYWEITGTTLALQISFKRKDDIPYDDVRLVLFNASRWAEAVQDGFAQRPVDGPGIYRFGPDAIGHFTIEPGLQRDAITWADVSDTIRGLDSWYENQKRDFAVEFGLHEHRGPNPRGFLASGGLRKGPGARDMRPVPQSRPSGYSIPPYRSQPGVPTVQDVS